MSYFDGEEAADEAVVEPAADDGSEVAVDEPVA